jgi:hypothetical protein
MQETGHDNALLLLEENKISRHQETAGSHPKPGSNQRGATPVVPEISVKSTIASFSFSKIIVVTGNSCNQDIKHL